MQALVFPTYLSQNEWKYRTISFNAMTHDISHYDSESAMETARTTTIKVFNKGIDAANSALSSIGVDGLELDKVGGMKLENTIVLPLPNTMSDSQEHGWNEETSLMSQFLDDKLNVTPGDIAEGLGLGKIRKLVEWIAPKVSINSVISEGAHSAGIRKPLIDPGYYQNYTGSRPRRFTMSFDLIPDNAKEAEIIRQIIIMFKKCSSPSIGINGVSLRAPYYWNVQIGNPWISKMMRMDCMVITNISVDYGASGSIQQFADGFPKHIQMQLQMSEARLTYADNYDGTLQEVEANNDVTQKKQNGLS